MPLEKSKGVFLLDNYNFKCIVEVYVLVKMIFTSLHP